MNLREAADWSKFRGNGPIFSRAFALLEDALASVEHKAPAARIYAQAADVADENQIDAFFDATARALGRIDILVNNAGIYGPMGSIDTIDWKEWVKAIAIHRQEAGSPE